MSLPLSVRSEVPPSDNSGGAARHRPASLPLPTIPHRGVPAQPPALRHPTAAPPVCPQRPRGQASRDGRPLPSLQVAARAVPREPLAVPRLRATPPVVAVRRGGLPSPPGRSSLPSPFSRLRCRLSPRDRLRSPGGGRRPLAVAGARGGVPQTASQSDAARSFALTLVERETAPGQECPGHGTPATAALRATPRRGAGGTTATAGPQARVHRTHPDARPTASTFHQTKRGREAPVALRARVARAPGRDRSGRRHPRGPVRGRRCRR